LGSYDSAEAAAKAYDQDALAYFDCEAVLNFPTKQHLLKAQHNRKGPNAKLATSYLEQMQCKAARSAGDSSELKSVSAVGKKWKARLYDKGQTKSLGTYSSETKAAAAYDVAARTAGKTTLNFDTLEEAKKVLQQPDQISFHFRSHLPSSSSSSFRGVTHTGGKWRARLHHSGITENLGTFNTEQEAADKCKAQIEINQTKAKADFTKGDDEPAKKRPRQ